MRVLILSLLILGLTSSMHAQSTDTAAKQIEECYIAPLTSDRPGQTFSATILHRGSLQWQQGFEWRDFYSRNADVININQRQLINQTSLRLGLGYGIEAGLSFNMNGINQPFFDDEFSWDFDNPNLMVRFALPGSNSRFQWAAIVQSSFSNLDYRLAANLNDGPWSVGGNLGFYHNEDEAYSAQWTVILAYSDQWYGVFAEVYGLSLNAANRDYLGFDAGLSFAIGPNFQWEVFAGNQAGFAPGINLVTSYFVNTGFTWRIR